tara:strand:+ start:145 stop:309 length:165 start_codon:yes stop_codon:yes gene_type:complete
MTKDEIRNALGEPTAITVSDSFEHWSYALNPRNGRTDPQIRFYEGRVDAFQEPD